MKKSSNEKKIAIYSRKSRFTGKGDSVGNQVELCREYIHMAYGDELAESVEVFEDEGFSGGNLNRPAFQKMLEAAREHKFSAIVVYRLDRISRNIGDFANLIGELSKLDVAFVSIREQFDTNSPMGRAMMYIASVFSQLERETIAERIRDNMHELAKTGRWLGGTTPTGYTSESVSTVTVDGKQKKACKLKLIPEEAEIVRLIFDLYIKYDSLTKVETDILNRRIKTKRGNDFTRFSIKGILQNPVYLMADEEAYKYFVDNEAELFSEKSEFNGVNGIIAYNRTDQEKGRAVIYNPINEWVVSVGAHPGIIPSSMWIKVQESLEKNKSKSYRKPRNNEALLTGLLFCTCGNKMYPKVSKRVTADGEPIFTYVCKLKDTSRKQLCDSKNINGLILDRAVVEQIKLLAENDSVFLKQLDRSKKYYTGDREEYSAKYKELREEKAEIERQIRNLISNMAKMDDSPAVGYVQQRIDELNEEKKELEARIDEFKSLTIKHPLSDIEFDMMKQLLTMFKTSIDDMSLEQKRTAVRTLVRKIIWDGSSAHMVLFGNDGDIDYTDISVFSNVQLSVPNDDIACENGTTDDKSPPDSAHMLHRGEDSK